MNWLKVGLFTALSPILQTIGVVLQSNISGQHVPITAGTILVPSIPIVAGVLAALFTHRPQQ